jgi:predicted DNA-binding transcriptional regulator AlpA
MDSRQKPSRPQPEAPSVTASIGARYLKNAPVPCQTLTATQAAAFTGIGVRSWWRCVSSGKAPKPFYIGRSARWLTSTVNEWLEQGCPPCRR